MTTTTTGAQEITKGTRFRGKYGPCEACMGAFTGTVAFVESDASGYRGTENDVRVYIELDSELVFPAWTDSDGTPIAAYRRAGPGDRIILHGRRVNGKIVRDDSRFSDLFIVRR